MGPNVIPEGSQRERSLWQVLSDPFVQVWFAMMAGAHAAMRIVFGERWRRDTHANLDGGGVLKLIIGVVIVFAVLAATIAIILSNTADVRTELSDTTAVEAAVGSENVAFFTGLVVIFGLLVAIFILNLVFKSMGFDILDKIKGGGKGGV